MLKVDRTARTFSTLDSPTLAEASLLERADLQECIYNSSDAFFAEIGETLFVVGMELSPSQTVADRIDILCVDQEGTSVIVELKRGRNKLQMFQAISYAGMIAHWSPEDFRQVMSEPAWDALVEFLEVDVEEINRRQRLLLVAEGYDYALLAGAEWLTEQFGVDIRCAGVSLATDPSSHAEYLACSNVFPAPALVEQAVARQRSSRGTRPIKWTDWDEAVAAIANLPLRSFLEAELASGRESYLRRRGIFYRIDGKRRYSLYCRKNSAYVWQRGRFEGDQLFWQERLGDPDAIKVVKDGQALSFRLHTADDLRGFADAVHGSLVKVEWVTALETADDEFE